MKRTEANMRVLDALRIDAGRDAGASGMTLDNIKAVGGYDGNKRALRSLMLRLRRQGMVAEIAPGRPRRFAITTAGLRHVGSFPAAGEAYAETFENITRKGQ